MSLLFCRGEGGITVIIVFRVIRVSRVVKAIGVIRVNKFIDLDHGVSDVPLLSFLSFETLMILLYLISIISTFIFISNVNLS